MLKKCVGTIIFAGATLLSYVTEGGVIFYAGKFAMMLAAATATCTIPLLLIGGLSAFIFYKIGNLLASPLYDGLDYVAKVGADISGIYSGRTVATSDIAQERIRGTNTRTNLIRDFTINPGIRANSRNLFNTDRIYLRRNSRSRDI